MSLFRWVQVINQQYYFQSICLPQKVVHDGPGLSQFRCELISESLFEDKEHYSTDYRPMARLAATSYMASTQCLERAFKWRKIWTKESYGSVNCEHQTNALVDEIFIEGKIRVVVVGIGWKPKHLLGRRVQFKANRFITVSQKSKAL